MRASIAIAVAAVLALVAFFVWSRNDGARSSSHGVTRPADSSAPQAPTESTDGKPRDGAPTGPSLRGRVVEEATDAPVAGAAVAVYSFRTADAMRATTARDGTFEIPGPPATQALHLVVRRAGFGEASRRCTAAESPVVIRLRPAGGIRGRIVAADGGIPLSPCRVSAFRCRAESEPWDPHDALLRQLLPAELLIEASASTHADGSFEIPDLRPGPYALLVEAEGFAPHALGWLQEKERVQVQAGAVAEVEIALPRTEEFLVDVVDEETGAPLDGVLFELGLRVERWTKFEPVTAEHRPDGAYALCGGYGEHRFEATWLRVRHEGYAPRVVTFDGQQAGYRFRVPLGRPGTIVGHVWSCGEPAEGAHVLVESASGGDLVGAAVTGLDGAFEVGCLGPGDKLTVHAYDAAHEPIAVVCLVLKGGERRTLEIGGSTGTAIEGRVVVGGRPAASASVRVSGASDADASTGRNGGYRFDGLAAGKHEVEFFTDGGYFDRYVDLAEGQRLRLDIEASVAIPGVVIDAETGAPLAGVEYLEVFAQRQGSRDVDGGDVDLEGRFRLHVEAGVYDLDMPESEEAYVVERPRIDVSAGIDAEQVTLRVVRDRMDGKITLDVKDAATGETVSDGDYEHAYKRTMGWGSFEDGAVTEESLPLGQHRFRVHTDAHAPTKIEVTLTPERRLVRQTVVLRPSEAVRITEIERGGGAALAGLEVGDTILACNGNPTASIAALDATLAAARGTVSIEYERGGARRTTTLPSNVLGAELENILLGR